MGHFGRQCREPRRKYYQQGQASLMTDTGIHFYQPYLAMPLLPPPPYEENPIQYDFPKNE